jgi:hypothetical protein
MRIIVHIGHYKTGTSALQRRLSDNRALLAEHGIVYPELTTLVEPNGQVLASHSPLVFAFLQTRGFPVGPPWYSDLVASAPEPPTLASLRAALDAAIDQARVDDHDVILSSEELMRFATGGNHDGAVAEFAEFFGDAPVEIFCHLRRPDLHLRSWYNQLTKLGQRRDNMGSDVGYYFDRIHVDYALALRPWVEHYGVDHVTVHRYEDRIGDIAEDLLRAYGHDVELPEETEVWENTRFPDVYIETLRLWNELRAPAHLTSRLREAMITSAERDGLGDIAVEFFGPRARRLLHERCVAMVADLDDLLGDRAPRFDDLDAMLEPVADAITDQAAHTQFGPAVLDEAFVPRPGPSAVADGSGAGAANGPGMAAAGPAAAIRRVATGARRRLALRRGSTT